MKQFEHLLFVAKPDKIEILRDYCRKNSIGCYEVCENIPIFKLKQFEKFLEDHEICADKTTFLTAVPTKNKELLQELQDFATKNEFIVNIEETGAYIMDISNVVADSPEFEKLLRKLEDEFHKELRQ